MASPRPRVCSVCGSTYKVARFKGGDVYCQRHYLQMYKYGRIYQDGKPRWTNRVIDDDRGCRIITAKGDEILVDKDLLPLLTRYSWCVSKTGYAVAKANGKLIRMHRLITNCPDGYVVDHINGNPLDNRRINLRICSAKNNSRNKGIGKNNSTGVLGVSQLPDGRWRARIMVNRKEISLGRFDSFEEALQARREAERKHFGSFARTGTS